MTTYTYEYPRPSVTATIFAFYDNALVVGTRSDDSDAYPGCKCIPGGFLNAKSDTFEGETVKQAAIREFREECGINLIEDQLILVHEHSDPDTDPRAHVVNLCYIARLTNDQAACMEPGDDLKALSLFPITTSYDYDFWQGWAFNHYDLVMCIINIWNSRSKYNYFFSND